MISLTVVHERYRALSLRERVLVLVTLAALAWGAWLSTFGGFLAEQVTQKRNELAGVTQKLDVQTELLRTLQRQSRSSPVAQLKQERDSLRDELKLVEAEVAQLLDKFIPAEQVPLLLEDVLSTHHGLELIAIRSKPAQKVRMQLQQGVTAETEDTAEVEIYRHPIQIEFSGAYRDVLAYVNELEQSEWQFAWRRLEYAVVEYPRAVVLLEVETLSDEMEWLGV